MKFKVLITASLTAGSTLAFSQTGGPQSLPQTNHTGNDSFQGVIGRTLSQSKLINIPKVKLKQGSPNVVYIVLDDVGFSDLGSYGSEISTPNLDRLALNGVRFNNFHTRAICSPTRASLLTGRNSHTVGINTVTDLQDGFPNSRGRITPHAATVAQILGQAGYATYAVGKWHLLNDASKPAQRDTQYFELHGHRAIWHDGWKAIAYHNPGADYDKEQWELYDLTKDFSESNDLALSKPDVLASLKSLW